MIKKWWKEAVIYEIYCKSFFDTDGDGLGDLKGVIEKIPYLNELGINCIWFTPIYCSPQFDNGYDVSDYYDIEKDYGGLEVFEELIEKAHAAGIKIVMDMVLNHSSNKCKWFIESRKSKDNPYRNYYYWRPAKPDGSEPNNWGNYFRTGNGSAWTLDEQTGEYYLGLYGEFMPDLNWECAELREEIYSMMRYWLDKGVDGFRLDVLTKIKKPAGLPDVLDREPRDDGYCVFACDCQEGIHDFFRELRSNTWAREEFDAFGLAEASGIRYDNALDFLLPEREELDLSYHFQIVNRAPNPPSVLYYKEVQQGWMENFAKGIWPTQHLANHDMPRQTSRFGNDKEYRERSAKMLATVTHLMPGTVFVYQGEEIGMVNCYFDSIEDYNDRYTIGNYWAGIRAGKTPKESLDAFKHVSRDNARRPIPWNDSKNGGFTTGTPWIKLDPNYTEINVEKDMANKNSVFNYYKKLIALRKQDETVVYGDFKMFYPDDEKLVSFARSLNDETLLVVANWSDNNVDFTLPDEFAGKELCVVLTNIEENIGKDVSRTLEPWEAIIYKIN